MKSNNPPSILSGMRTAILVSFFISTVIFISCKKENRETTAANSTMAALIEEESDETVYSVDNPQQALNDVTLAGGRLAFRNTSHFFTTAIILDSLGDSSADAWLQGKGFLSLFNEFKNAINTIPEEAEQADLDQYFNNNSNAIRYNAATQEWDVNAANGIIARLLNTEHKANIGGNVIYSDYNVIVTVGAADEGMIQAYAAEPEDRVDNNAIVQHQNVPANKTTGTISVPWGTEWTIGEINCGSPISKRSRVHLHNMKYAGYSIGAVKIWHEKRGFFAWQWPGESRGSQISGYFDGNWVTGTQNWGNSAKYHLYHVSYHTGLGSWLPLVVNNMTVCVAPMCWGNTMCAYY